MNFTKVDQAEAIEDLRSQLYQKLTAPIDAMWELLYIASSQHHLIVKDDHTLGYCCINDQGSLLQLFLLPEYNSLMNQVIAELIKSELITTASLSSNEPISFNACLSLSKRIEVNTYCYEHLNAPRNIEPSLKLELVTTQAISAIKAFLKEQLGMDDTFGYTENLVSRKEIFMLRQSNTVVATSECRMSDSQPSIADLGIVVNRDFQGKGIATQVLQMQVNRVLKAGRKPICSTTLDNIASQKAIEKAGFYRSNIIFDIHF